MSRVIKSSHLKHDDVSIKRRRRSQASHPPSVGPSGSASCLIDLTPTISDDYTRANKRDGELPACGQILNQIRGVLRITREYYDLYRTLCGFWRTTWTFLVPLDSSLSSYEEWMQQRSFIRDPGHHREDDIMRQEDAAARTSASGFSPQLDRVLKTTRGRKTTVCAVSFHEGSSKHPFSSFCPETNKAELLPPTRFTILQETEEVLPSS
ncbi:hypothetical protein Q7C36_019736 [Tachysurus vachellii]|uniref:Uncharacterized protein n=1 Tax=Tachysurus vachellii TaxID=175792 RepID=A0AA88LSG7_TACVA|nr:hypothetical protein Q7C36_019736 [Tachysurus vachellii]